MTEYPEFNEFQDKILRHLTSGGRERLGALADLKVKGVLDVAYNSTANSTARTRAIEDQRRVVEIYLQSNPRGFCEAGIERFREAIGLFATPTKTTTTIDYVVRVEVEADAASTALPYGAVGPTAQEIRRCIIQDSLPTRGKGEVSGSITSKIVSADIRGRTIINRKVHN